MMLTKTNTNNKEDHMTAYAYITTKDGMLAAECENENGTLYCFDLPGNLDLGFGETVDLPDVPMDEFELQDMLYAIANGEEW